MADHIATAEIDTFAPPSRVWAALTDPAQIRQYFFGSVVDTDWAVGSPITWSGEYEGKAYQDKGEVLECTPETRLKVSHFSPLAGQPDEPENYHVITYDLSARDGGTHVSMTQDNNGDDDEARRASSTWETMLAGLKKTVEAD